MTDSDGTDTLRALELLALRRRAFVQIARDYNRRIARYAELATPGEIGAERLVGMLIKRAGASTATRPRVPPRLECRQSRSATTAPPQHLRAKVGSRPARAAASTTRDDAVDAGLRRSIASGRARGTLAAG